jgi:hypothetical protein
MTNKIHITPYTNSGTTLGSTTYTIDNAYITLTTDVGTNSGSPLLPNPDPYYDLPIVDYNGGPIYAADQYFESVDDFFDWCADADTHPSTEHCHPVLKRKAHTPSSDSLLDYISEVWSQEFDDHDEFDFSKEVQDLMDRLTFALRAEAPTVWEAQMNKRLVLVSPDLDDEFDPDEDRYDD